MATMETPVSDAFARPPSMAQRFRSAYENSEAYAAERGADPATVQHAAQQVVAPEPQPMQYFQPAGAQPQVAPMQRPVAPQPSYYEQQAMARMQQEHEALRQQVAQQQALIQQMAAEREQAAAAQTQEELISKVAENPDLQNLEDVGPEDAKRIAAAAASVLREPIDALRADLERQRQVQYQAWQQAESVRKAREVVNAHPDLNMLKDNPAFVSFMNGRDGYSSRTREQLAQDEYNAGNTAYVIDLINRFKAGMPNRAQAVSVPPVQVAGSAVNAVQTAPPTPKFTLGELNSLMQMHRISQDQYRAMKPLVDAS